MKSKLIMGVGTNDAGYNVTWTSISGAEVRCIFYRKWTDMLQRCYSTRFHKKQPTYIGCTVCDEWLTFSNFKKWMEGQDWKGNELDKDILIKGNKVYSPSTCVFVSASLNNFTNDRGMHRGDCMIGVSKHRIKNMFRAQCNNPITGKKEHLGLYSSDIGAHLAWKRRKHEIACQLADLQNDRRVASALRSRYSES